MTVFTSYSLGTHRQSISALILIASSSAQTPAGETIPTPHGRKACSVNSTSLDWPVRTSGRAEFACSLDTRIGIRTFGFVIGFVVGRERLQERRYGRAAAARLLTLRKARLIAEYRQVDDASRRRVRP
jgi:hypothetical protein